MMTIRMKQIVKIFAWKMILYFSHAMIPPGVVGRYGLDLVWFQEKIVVIFLKSLYICTTQFIWRVASLNKMNKASQKLILMYLFRDPRITQNWKQAT